MIYNKPLTGLEPATPRLEVWCAIRLRHRGEKDTSNNAIIVEGH